MLKTTMSFRSDKRILRQDQWARAIAKTERLRIRPYQTRDRKAIEHILCNTAMRGQPMTQFFEDKKILLGIFMNYYLQHEPDACYVAEVDQKIVGYVLGCKNTSRYLRVVVFHYGPKLAASLLVRFITGSYRQSSTYRTLWWMLARARREVPSVNLKQFPGHLHLGIDQSLHNNSLAFYICIVRLGNTLISHFKEKKVRGLHGQIAEPENQEFLTRRLKTLFGGQILTKHRFTLWKHTANKKWYIKLLTLDLEQKPHY